MKEQEERAYRLGGRVGRGVFLLSVFLMSLSVATALYMETDHVPFRYALF